LDLLFDLGNSRLKWAGWEHGHLVRPNAAVWRAEGATEFCDTVLKATVFLQSPRRVAIGSVARGELLPALQAAVRARWGIAAWLAAPTDCCGAIRNGYSDPTQLGFDRWAALIGAWRRRPNAPAIVVDCGSAVTVDGLRADGQHLGGVIFPGLDLMAEAFYARTGLAVEVAGGGLDLAGRSTADAVAAGARVAVLGGIERAVRPLYERLPGSGIWLTGGDAPALASALSLPAPVRLAPHLVLEGLGQILALEG
jgi:type III pantothenate kinase